ncbi:hypothetical protein ACW5UC_24135 [Priestia aryabhattai]|uniref:hypothetical protein n=1 Tax=Priestia megaterium TaxID=1404 RepID=UPI003F992915
MSEILGFQRDLRRSWQIIKERSEKTKDRNEKIIMKHKSFFEHIKNKKRVFAPKPDAVRHQQL